MGAVQSDLKASIVQASSGKNVIPPGNDAYWSTYWDRPETTEHVFETFTASDIRCMRDDQIARANFKTLILKVSLRLLRDCTLCSSLSGDHQSDGTRILNCLRILTRTFPYLYESDDWRAWEDSTFWQVNDDPSRYLQYDRDASKYINQDTSLGAQIVSALTDLLFFTGFTLPWPDAETEATGDARVSYGLWQSGIACDATVITSREYESRRSEILQLLLAMESKSIYQPPQKYILTDTQAITCLVRHCSKRRVQSLLCSLLNTVCKYHPESWLSFDPRSPQTESVRDRHVKLCLHVLLVNMLNRAPWDDSDRERNEFRLQFSYLHTPKHFQSLADGISKVLRQPLETNASVLALGSKSTMAAWAPEMILLLWETLRCNRKFLHYIIESGRALDFMVLLIFYARQSHMEGIGRVCTFCLQTMSAAPGFGSILSRAFKGQATLPISIQIKNFHGSYSDYLISSVLTLLECSASEATHWSMSLVAIIANVAPDIKRLARATSTKLVQSFTRRTKPAILLSSEANLDLAIALLETINILIETHGPDHENETILYAVWRARERFEAVRALSQSGEERLLSATPSSSSAWINCDLPPETDDSAQGVKSRGKQPSVQGSVSKSFKAKLMDMPLQVPLSAIENINDRLGDQQDQPVSAVSADSRRSSVVSLSRLPSREGQQAEILQAIRESTLSFPASTSRHEPETFRFEAPIAALYASYYWGLVISQDVQRAAETGRGVWFGTNIRLFGIRAGEVQGPSLWSPRGAVDAVGESLIAGVRDLTMRARRSMSGETG